MSNTSRAAVILSCSQCPTGTYAHRDGLGVCRVCGNEVDPGLDVVPHLDDGEEITWTTDETGARLLAYIPADD